MSALASFRSFGVTYRRDGEQVSALQDVDLDIVAGETLGVIGESGSGKSTLALALADLLPASARLQGSLGWPTAPRPKPGRDIGYIFQDPGGSLNPVLTIGSQIAEVVAVNLGKDRRAAQAEAVDLIARVRLPDPERIARAYPHELSGGQRQRVAIAAAIAGRPSLLIADEATSALDTIVQAQIVTLIRELVAGSGMTLVFVSHDIALASGFADRIAVFRSGRLVEVGATRQVLGTPGTAYTRQLIDAHRAVEA